jgi:hypothetical protein
VGEGPVGHRVLQSYVRFGSAGPSLCPPFTGDAHQRVRHYNATEVRALHIRQADKTNPVGSWG